MSSKVKSAKNDLQHPRYSLAANVELQPPDASAAVSATLRNISLSGCYLQGPTAIPENTRLRILLNTADLRADLWGVVRRRDADGIGIQFTNGVTVEDWKHLEHLVAALRSIGAQTRF
ncbi:MAG TPA: PilZ domain-containing protein [Terriglobales bacterium]|nr:PilZ domain-containing protein [Terriglobales bacterium]